MNEQHLSSYIPNYLFLQTILISSCSCQSDIDNTLIYWPFNFETKTFNKHAY